MALILFVLLLKDLQFNDGDEVLHINRRLQGAVVVAVASNSQQQVKCLVQIVEFAATPKRQRSRFHEYECVLCTNADDSVVVALDAIVLVDVR